MKILLIDQFGEMGGAQRCLVEAAMGFAERGWELHALIPTGATQERATQESPLHQALKPYCAKIRPLPCGPFASGAKTASDAARLALQLPRQAWEIARTTARERVDVIFVNGPRVLPAAALGRNGRPLIYHSHWMVPQRSAASLARTALRKSGASVIATSGLAAEWLQGSVEPHLVSTIYNGVAGFGISALAACVRNRSQAGGLCANVSLQLLDCPTTLQPPACLTTLQPPACPTTLQPSACPTTLQPPACPTTLQLRSTVPNTLQPSLRLFHNHATPLPVPQPWQIPTACPQHLRNPSTCSTTCRNPSTCPTTLQPPACPTTLGRGRRLFHFPVTPARPGQGRVSAILDRCCSPQIAIPMGRVSPGKRSALEFAYARL